jgi:hypothetical protein
VLSDSILLGCVANSVLAANTSISQESSKGAHHVFTTLIIPKDAEVAPCHVLSPCLVLLESIKNIQFLSNKVDSRKVQVVVDKGHPKEVTMAAANRHRAMNIRKHPEERPLSADSRLCVGCASEFTIHTVFTEVICNGMGDKIWDAGDRFRVNEPSDDWIRHVVEMRMKVCNGDAG